MKPSSEYLTLGRQLQSWDILSASLYWGLLRLSDHLSDMLLSCHRNKRRSYLLTYCTLRVGTWVLLYLYGSIYLNLQRIRLV